MLFNLELIYVVVLFVMMFMDIALIFVKAGLLNVVFGFFSLMLMAYCVSDSSIYVEIPFHPYLLVLLGLTGSVCMLVAAARFKGWV